MDSVISRLEADVEQKRAQFRKGFDVFAARHELTDWEGWYSPYGQEVYDAVLHNIENDDMVLDIGAGDLRLALRMAQRARKVYAVEVNPLVLGPALEAIGFVLPRNLMAICANTLDYPFPDDITVAVLLMRHCQHFRQYVERLRQLGCRRLITNARFKSRVEVINLAERGADFSQVHGGWYACLCGEVGFVPCPSTCAEECPDDLCLTQVESCPACAGDETTEGALP
jgi:SAM-dependent methyltransferase